MPVHRQRKPSETIVSTGNEEKITLDDVLKKWGPTVKMAQALATRLVIDENGYLRVVDLPETDPMIDGALYLDGGDLKVSRPL